MDLHTRWPHRWVSPKTKSQPSSISGWGVIATEEIKKGEHIAVLGGVIVPRKEIREYWKHMGHVGIQLDTDFFIVPTTREELETLGVFNHSCEPNIGFSNSITFIAIRDIAAGEELVFDYAFNETEVDPFTCNCGSEVCRGTITPQDWQIKEIQEKHKAYYSPYLREKLF